MTLSHQSLGNHYHTNWVLKTHHGYSLSELEDMVPWEREVYLQFIISDLEKKKQENN